MLLQCGHGGEAVENKMMTAWKLNQQQCFNAATAVRPWRTLARLLQHSQGAGFNAATAVRPWRTSETGKNTRSTATSFNAATAVRPWRTSCTSGLGHTDTAL